MDAWLRSISFIWMIIFFHFSSSFWGQEHMSFVRPIALNYLYWVKKALLYPTQKKLLRNPKFEYLDFIHITYM